MVTPASPPQRSAKAERRRDVLLAILAVIGVGFVLYVTRPVMTLVVLAGVLAILLQPAVARLQRFLSKPVALIVVMFGLFTLLIGFGAGLVMQARSVAEKAPEYTERMERILAEGLDVASNLGIELTTKELGTSQAIGNAIEVITSGMASFFSASTQLLLVLIMVLFMLIEAPAFRDKLAGLLKAEHRDKVTHSIDSATRKVQRYIVAKTLVSLFTGVLTYVVTAAIGLDFPFIWGAIAFQLNFVPYLGSIVAVFPPALMALIQFESWPMSVAILMGLGAMQFTIGNLIEPRIMGRTLALSPLVVFVALLFWGWFWGILGVVLSVPLTAIIKVICEHVDALKPVAVLMGDGTVERRVLGVGPQDEPPDAEDSEPEPG